jgi:hypothetical protein
LAIREEVVYLGKERGTEAGGGDVMYDDLSPKEYKKMELKQERDREEFNNSDYGRFVHSLRSSLEKFQNKKLEIDLFLSTKLK